MIGFDTVDEIFRLAENRIVKEFNASVSNICVKSIKQCYGGYQAGENRVIDRVISTIKLVRGMVYRTKQKE